MKKNNIFLKIKLIISVLIVSLVMPLMVYSIVTATEMNFIGNDELINIDSNLGAASSTSYAPIATYHPTYTYQGSASDFKEILNRTPFTLLSTDHGVYCRQYGGRLFDNPHGTLTTEHKGSYSMDSAVNFEKPGDTPTWNGSGKWEDFKDGNESPSQSDKEADTHIRFDTWGTTLSVTEAYAVSFNGQDHGGSHGQGQACGGPYNTFPSQHAVWQMENDLYKAGKSVEILKSEISSRGETPEVSPIRKSGTVGCGTVLEGEYYKIGPFSMSDYAYVAYLGVNEYSGKGLKYPTLVGGISDGWITLNNGTKINFDDITIEWFNGNHGDNNRGGSITYNEYSGSLHTSDGILDGSTTTRNGGVWGAPNNYKFPWPNSKFYIRVKRSDCGNATTLSSFTFKYRKTDAYGSGFEADGEYVRPTFDIEELGKGCTVYKATCSWSGYNDAAVTSSTGGSQSNTHTHYKNGCTCSGCEEHSHVDACHTDSDPAKDLECGKTEHTHSTGTDCCGGHSHTSTLDFKCEHDHRDCKKFNWKGKLQTLDAQTLLAVLEATTIVEEKEVTSTVNVRLTTDLTINKYIVKVEHIGETGVIYNNKTERKTPKTKDEKNADPVPAERGDRVTYYIDIINAQDQKVSCRIEDTFPSASDQHTLKLEVGGTNVNKNTWIVVDGNSTTRVIATLVTTADSGKWENAVKIITNNSGNPDYNRTEYLAPTANPSPKGADARHHGPVVNVAEIAGRPQEDSDYYVIKEYNVSIEKYIYDVKHNTSTGIRGGEVVALTNSNERSRTNTSITEQIKKDNPVYVEYGDTVTYKIVVYNTPNNYAPFNVARAGEPYWNPDKVYVNLTDTLPKKFSNLKVEVEASTVTGNNSHVITAPTGTLVTSGGSIVITDLMVPAGEKRVVTVTLKVEEHVKGTIEENKVEFNPADMRNINRGPGKGTSARAANKYCVIKNNSTNTTTSDWYILNNYNTFTDKYVYKYDETMQYDNEENGYLTGGYVSGSDGVLIESRRNTTATTKTETDPNNMVDTVRVSDNKETDKKNRPVSVEKTETLTYRIAVTNDAETVTKTGGISSGRKIPTRVRTSTVTDYLEVGLHLETVTAAIYSDEAGTTKVSGGDVKVTSTFKETKEVDGRKFNVYEFTVGNENIVNPNETIIYEVTVRVEQSNMYLNDLQNRATLTRLTNINNTDTETREVKNNTYNEDISSQHPNGSSDFVRMKDLVIGGYVWLDFNKDGLKNDTTPGDKEKAYYNLNNNAMKRDLVVKLYQVVNGQGKLIRTTRTNEDGFYTFGKGKDNKFEWRENDYNYAVDTTSGGGSSKAYSVSSNLNLDYYQRLDKATDKDGYGNYTANSKLIEYYIEFEYDGIVYKSTEFYSGTDNIDTAIDSNNFGEPINEYNTPGDSNALEFTDTREDFNRKYEYITYDKAYDVNKGVSSNGDLSFDKDNHASYLIEDPSRAMTARSFIKADTIKGRYSLNHNQWNPTPCNSSLDKTNTLWLFEFDDSTNNKTPSTEYLKDINLGLELREDVDITLTKDVYSVKTLINGEEMEYFFNQNNTFNGESATIDKSKVTGGDTGLYLNDFIVKTPYGLDLYESDYKMRVDQYASTAVKTYKGLQGESELNTEVTYRITVANKAINDDETQNKDVTKDTKLKVKISEILDLYDENFKEVIVGTDGSVEEESVKVKDENGYLIDGKIAYAEAWYFEEYTNPVGSTTSEDIYIIANETTLPTVYSNGMSSDKPVFININSVDPTLLTGSVKKYKKHMLKLSNTSMLGEETQEPKNSNKENRNDYKADGYYTLYISGMEDDDKLTLSEGQDFDIYVKYLLDKDKNDEIKVDVTNTDYEDTRTETFDIYDLTDKQIGTADGTVTISGKETIINRSLRIKDQRNKSIETARGLEGIAQVNLYSVWYEDENGTEQPASLVDMDSNAGNLGNQNDGLMEALKNVTDTDSRKQLINTAKLAKKNTQTSADNWSLYEDTAYKTGIEITADGTEWTKEDVKKLYVGYNIEIQDKKMLRELTGRVWDDSRSERIDESGGVANTKNIHYLANGIYKPVDSSGNNGDHKLEDALDNKNVPLNYDNESATANISQKANRKPDEEQDIKVRNIKAELVEIVEIPQSDGTSHYYEEVLGCVTWEQAQHIRTNQDGDYKLTGFIPGKYVVRFTYGDTVTSLTNAESEHIGNIPVEQVAADMQVFNGQDYKTTKYAYDMTTYSDAVNSTSVEGGTQVADVPESAKKITDENGVERDATIDNYAADKLSNSGEVSNNDIVMIALERPDLSDARDDEIRRLEVNNYSEVMISEKAEILKGLANNTQLSTRTLGANTNDEVSVNYYRNFENFPNEFNENLRTLTDATNMNAETVEFLVKPEKLTYQQTNENSYYTKLTAKEQTNKDYYYNELDTIVHEIITSREYKISNIDMGIEYRPETNISLTKEIDRILLIPSDETEPLVNLKLYTEYETDANGIERAKHKIDFKQSTGANNVQFISNTYEIDPLLANIVNIHEEHKQGFIYIAVDEEVLQGCKIIVQYKFTAQNNSEVDKVSEQLDGMRFYGNNNTTGTGKLKTQNLVSAYPGVEAIGKNTNNVDEYTANNFARNILYSDVYEADYEPNGKIVIYRNRAKTMTQDLVNGSADADNLDGYFGKYVGYTYYVGDDRHELDKIAEMKFDRIVDYVDTDLEFEQLSQDDSTWLTNVGSVNNNAQSGINSVLSNGNDTKDMKSTTNQSWSNIFAALIGASGTPYEGSTPIVSESAIEEVKSSIFMLGSPWSELATSSNPLQALSNILQDMNGIEYKSLVMTVADKKSDNDNTNANKEFSKFLQPRVVNEDASKATIYLPVSKLLASETDTDNMLYENIAEVIQFTVLTGRRTNFDTTIGNADIHTVEDQNNRATTGQNSNIEKYGSVEFVTAAFEKDTSSTETITLTPPTGLMKSRIVIYEAVETTKDVLKITVIAVAVVVIAIVVTKFTILKIKKRRYK